MPLQVLSYIYIHTYKNENVNSPPGVPSWSWGAYFQVQTVVPQFNCQNIVIHSLRDSSLRVRKPSLSLRFQLHKLTAEKGRLANSAAECLLGWGGGAAGWAWVFVCGLQRMDRPQDYIKAFWLWYVEGWSFRSGATVVVQLNDGSKSFPKGSYVCLGCPHWRLVFERKERERRTDEFVCFPEV